MASQIDPTTIDTTYPIAGQDNDTRGFHDNYRAIQNGLLFAKTEITALQANIVTLTANDAANYGNANVSTYLSSYDGSIRFTASPAVISGLGNVSTVTMALSSAIQLANLTTTQRNTITAVNGMMIYNNTFNKFQGYANGSWGNITLT